MSFEKNTNLSALLCSIEFALISNVERIRDFPNLSKGVILKSGKSWSPLPFISGTGSYSHEQKPSDAGAYFEHQVKCFCPGTSISTQAELTNLHNNRYLAKITLMTGVSLLIGNLDVPISLSSSLDTVKGGRDFLAAWTSSEPAFSVDEP